MKLDLEKAIIHEIAKMLTVGFEYQTEYGTQIKEAALTPLIRKWVQDNKQEVIDSVIDSVGKEKIQQIVADHIVAELNSANWSSYKWKTLAEFTAPLIADRVAQKMYEEHKKEICK